MAAAASARTGSIGAGAPDNDRYAEGEPSTAPAIICDAGGRVVFCFNGGRLVMVDDGVSEALSTPA